MSKNYVIILMGGANNIVNVRCIDFKEKLDNFLRSLAGPRVVLVGVPFRYDSPSLNPEIYRVNLTLRNIAALHDNTYFICIESVYRKNIKHALNFNYEEKSHLANLLHLAIRESNLTPIKAVYKLSVESTNSNTTAVPKIPPSVPTKVFHHNRTFDNKHFLGIAHKLHGVPWSSGKCGKWQQNSIKSHMRRGGVGIWSQPDLKFPTLECEVLEGVCDHTSNR
ncbi:hypothetical protein J6590_005521 [Homalodisca vitripennis]|nr:hypothetical protein J6590_005521 [Homalodisca vitripennis]